MDPNSRQLNCLRCGEALRFLQKKDLTTGQGFFCDEGPVVDLYVCPGCGKLELYEGGVSGPQFQSGGGAALRCPRCGMAHREDDSACPLCGLSREDLEARQAAEDPPPPAPEPARPDREEGRGFFRRRRKDAKDPWD